MCLYRSLICTLNCFSSHMKSMTHMLLKWLVVCLLFLSINCATPPFPGSICFIFINRNYLMFEVVYHLLPYLNFLVPFFHHIPLLVERCVWSCMAYGWYAHSVSWNSAYFWFVSSVDCNWCSSSHTCKVLLLFDDYRKHKRIDNDCNSSWFMYFR